MTSVSRSQRSRHAPKYSQTIYDSELAKYVTERNEAYTLLSDIETFAKNLCDGDYKNVGEHLLKLLYGDDYVQVSS